MRDTSKEQGAEVVENPAAVSGVLWRGVLMGIAEVVPGVSGGTIAFVTGIYNELVGSLARFGPQSLTLVAAPSRFWHHHNLTFLGSLGLGMLMGVLAFAQLMHYLLAHFAPVVWGFFVGVIAMSVVVIGHGRARRALLLWAPLGLLAGLMLLYVPPADADAGMLRLFIGGVIAVCAWLLPAVSGSFVLLSMGLYGLVIDAVAGFDLPVLLVLGSGCMVGIVAFARGLNWVLRHHEEALLSLLTGFMLGSIPKLWPWQLAETHGLAALTTPGAYLMVTGQPAFAWLTALSVMTGGCVLWLLTRAAPD